MSEFLFKSKSAMNKITKLKIEPFFEGFKMVLVGVIGTIIAAIGFLENTLVFYTFVSSRALRKKNLLYLKCLSACDIFICFSYVEIMSVQVAFPFSVSFKKKII